MALFFAMSNAYSISAFFSSLLRLPSFMVSLMKILMSSLPRSFDIRFSSDSFSCCSLVMFPKAVFIFWRCLTLSAPMLPSPNKPKATEVGASPRNVSILLSRSVASSKVISPNGTFARLLYTSSIYSSGSPWNCAFFAASLKVGLSFISLYSLPALLFVIYFMNSLAPPGTVSSTFFHIPLPSPLNALKIISDWFSRKVEAIDLPMALPISIPPSRPP